MNWNPGDARQQWWCIGSGQGGGSSSGVAVAAAATRIMESWNPGRNPGILGILGTLEF